MSTPTPNNIVLAIDPGFDRCGLAVMDSNGVIYSDCIETNRKDTPAKRLHQIGRKIEEVINEHSPRFLAIEKLFFNQNITTALKVAEARGVILERAAAADLEVFEYSPQDIKIAVTSYGKASKASVTDMVLKLVKLPPKDKRLDDELDAVALGITHLATRKGILYK